MKVAVSMMQPERLGINAFPEQAAGMLNQWRTVQLKAADQSRLSEPLSDETRAFLESQFSAESLQQTERDDYTPEDAKHVRTAMLMKDIVSHVVKGVDGELNRAQVLFDYVTRNVQLVAEDEALPLMPYEILILGEGTPADRAWVFTELLRQLNQDAVIVKPLSSDPAKDAGTWFVGAITDKEIRLFDPRRSTPVPLGPRGKQTDILPATPADLSKTSVLNALTGEAGDSGDSLSPQMFETLRIELIGTSALWAPRHAQLEKMLIGEDSVVIFQELTAAPDDSASILNRIAALEGGQWNPKEIRLWSHPESRFLAYQQADLAEHWKPFQAPYPILMEQETKELAVGNPTLGQLRTRTKQLRGQYNEAIRGYMRIRLAQQRVPSQVSADIRSLHVNAAEDAFFWSAVCQMEQDTPRDAVNKFYQYIQRTEQFTNSRHAEHARVLMARCLAQLGETPEAIEALEPLKATSPEYAAAMFLKRELVPDPSASPPPDQLKPLETRSPEAKSSQSKPDQPAIAEKPAS